MDNNKSWHHINLEDFEFKIRQEEREKEYQRRCNIRKANRIRIYKRRKAFMKALPMRILGLFLICASIKMLGCTHDGTFVLVTLPLGIVGLLCPLDSGDI